MNRTVSSRPVTEVVAGLGTMLGVWAHPDDEAYLSGGLMVAAVEAGARVVCVTATRGERGTADPEAWPPARLAEVRDAELAASLRVLGVAEHIQLGYPDGGCAAVPVAAAIHRLAGVIADVRPDTVLTFGPDGITGHADHRAVSAWTTAAVAAAGAPVPRLLYAAHAATWCDHFESLHRALGIFPAGLPHRFATEDLAIDVALPADLLDRKVASLRAQASQVTELVQTMGEEVFRAWVGNECFRSPRPAISSPM